MASVIMHSLRSLAAPYVVRQAAACVGEVPEATSRAIEAALPALLEALAVSVREPVGLGVIHGLVSEPCNDGVVLQNVASVFSSQHWDMPMRLLGGRLIELIFGDDMPLVTEAIAERSGIKVGSAEAILRAVAPLVLAAIGQNLRADGQLSQAALASLLTAEIPWAPASAVPATPSEPVTGPATTEAIAHVDAGQKPAGGARVRIADRIQLIVIKDPPPRQKPAELAVVPALVASPTAPQQGEPRATVLPAGPVTVPVVAPATRPATAPVAPTAAAPAVPAATPRATERRVVVPGPLVGPSIEAPRGTLWPLVAGGLGALLLILGVPLMSWITKYDVEHISPSSPSLDSAERRKGSKPLSSVGQETQQALARLRLDAPEGSMERRFIRLIEDSKPLGNGDWFELDRVTFQTASHTLLPSSSEQLRSVAEILKAYPTVRLKIGGYTDNVGEPARNLELSDARANAVMKALVDLGISPARMTAEGYGEQHPVGDNATADGRARNRRIAFRVTQR